MDGLDIKYMVESKETTEEEVKEKMKQFQDELKKEKLYLSLLKKEHLNMTEKWNIKMIIL